MEIIKMRGKKFLFGIISMVCISGVTAYLRYPAEIYFKMVTAITGIYILAQSYTDKQKGGQV